MMTIKEYTKHFEVLLKAGRSLEELNTANHVAFEKKIINYEGFRTVATMLAQEILKR